MAKLSMDVEILDKDICKECEQFKLATEKTKDAYGDEVVLPKCKYVDICKKIWGHLNSQALGLPD